MRALHDDAVSSAVERARPALQRFEDDFVAGLVPGDEIDPAAIRPVLRLVGKKGSPDARLWRWAALHWSVPTSLGYGRRLHYLVVDEGHGGALMGVLGLQDPVFALRSRDAWIGWSAERRALSLTDVMDAFVLGAVPPYRELLGAKLVGLLAMPSEVRADFGSRYAHRRTQIANRDPNAKLLAITTASALGRS